MNMRNMLDEQYYSQLKYINTAYCNTTSLQILKHLNTCWCALHIQARKILKKEFCANWDSSNIYITTFGMKLDKEQSQLDQLGIVISNEDKLQFYLEQIYGLNCFDKTEMVTWENKPVIIKGNYAQAKAYFENLVKDFKTYMQNSGGTAGKMGYESANHMADVGNKIRKYIQDIASATVADKERTAELAAIISKVSRAKDVQINSITTQIKLLTNTVALLSKSLANKENSGGGGNSGGRNGGNGGGLGGRRKFCTIRDMGSYCWSHRHHPVGTKHGSNTCTNKKEGHKDDPTATNYMGGNNYWPRENSPSRTTPATKASQPPGDKSQGWLPMKTNTK